jgi:hypothetical protein
LFGCLFSQTPQQDYCPWSATINNKQNGFKSPCARTAIPDNLYVTVELRVNNFALPSDSINNSGNAGHDEHDSGCATYHYRIESLSTIAAEAVTWQHFVQLEEHERMLQLIQLPAPVARLIMYHLLLRMCIEVCNDDRNLNPLFFFASVTLRLLSTRSQGQTSTGFFSPFDVQSTYWLYVPEQKLLIVGCSSPEIPILHILSFQQFGTKQKTA